MATIMPTWIKQEAVCAFRERLVLSKRSKWIGAPLAAVGDSPANVKSCRKFPRTRASHESDCTSGEKRSRRGERMISLRARLRIWPPTRLRRAANGECEAAGDTLGALRTHF